jgi:hypothetical protein
MPVETKVTVAGLAAAIAGVIDWVLNTYVFTGHGGIPGDLRPLLDIIIPAILVWAFAWIAPHMPRPPSSS